MKLNIYMKSGNKISTHFVKDYTISNQGDAIVKLTIERYPFSSWLNPERLLISTIALSQIEAITVS